MAYPAMLSCVMTRKAEFPSEDDIRNRNVKEDENTRLFQRFLEDEETKEEKLQKQREAFLGGLLAMQANFELNHPKKESE